MAISFVFPFVCFVLSNRHVVEHTKMLRRQQRRLLSLRRIAYRMVGRTPSAQQVTRITGDILEFGVYTGGGMKAWIDAMPLLGFNFTGQLWGFDSFVGMPAENQSLVLRHHKRDRSWAQGGLNAAKQLRIDHWPTLRDTLIKNVGFARTRLVRGFFNETLRGGVQRARELGITPAAAFLIDIDCDLYSSTRQALAFALESGLLRPGTFVYYDDLSEYDRSRADQADRRGGRATDAARRIASLNEENVAHDVTSREWGLRWLPLPSIVSYPGPLPLKWIEQLPPEHTGKWVPPERYPAVRELISCARCAL